MKMLPASNTLVFRIWPHVRCASSTIVLFFYSRAKVGVSVACFVLSRKPVVPNQGDTVYKTQGCRQLTRFSMCKIIKKYIFKTSSNLKAKCCLFLKLLYLSSAGCLKPEKVGKHCRKLLRPTFPRRNSRWCCACESVPYVAASRTNPLSRAHGGR